MTHQKRNDQLGLAAMRSTPVMNRRPQPATFMPPFGKPKRVAITEASDGLEDARYGGTPRARREAALAAANATWPFMVRESRI